ncbi:uncharacterized protein LOC126682452 [Mercurialis annua]|uniref:uncharacterized protein LOC126682452 n=1 Tax=Mercurialis annua TaxID=3986 RepID=UPI00215EB52E|nr:uncharacterized protein LOC126682452 [Mercurialis annua]XP_050234111.1 uncharacterized protein LOC126682452 [Mercurialis annua]
MDGSDRWRVVSCSQEKTIINPIMLRFRPIAPKPVGNGSGFSDCWNKNSLVMSNVRTKRKYVKVKKRTEFNYKRRRDKNKSVSSSDLEKEDDRTEEKLFTLQLLPEKIVDDEVKDSSGSSGSSAVVISKDYHEKSDLTAVTSFNYLSNKQRNGEADRRVLETVVTVESVTDTCMDELVLGVGSTDVERMKNLEKDTCPGFISDGSNRVEWVNEAYKKMIMTGNEGEQNISAVRLVIKEKVLPHLNNRAAFTCWVRLQYTWRTEKNIQMVPCDVWKMSFGGFAWRLDVKAALSLGVYKS